MSLTLHDNFVIPQLKKSSFLLDKNLIAYFHKPLLRTFFYHTKIFANAWKKLIISWIKVWTIQNLRWIFLFKLLELLTLLANSSCFWLIAFLNLISWWQQSSELSKESIRCKSYFCLNLCDTYTSNFFFKPSLCKWFFNDLINIFDDGRSKFASFSTFMLL